MSLVNVSLDTNTRQVVMTIDGVLVSAQECMLEKYVWDGEEFIRFAYTQESTSPTGMKERRQYYLPSPEELATMAKESVSEQGFASKIVHDDEKAKADVIDFLSKDKGTE